MEIAFNKRKCITKQPEVFLLCLYFSDDTLRYSVSIFLTEMESSYVADNCESDVRRLLEELVYSIGMCSPGHHHGQVSDDHAQQ